MDDKDNYISSPREDHGCGRATVSLFQVLFWGTIVVFFALLLPNH
jgi:hypothetical protein